jgi:hypothetical protein
MSGGAPAINKTYLSLAIPPLKVEELFIGLSPEQLESWLIRKSLPFLFSLLSYPPNIQEKN